ncbi:MAG: ATP-binding cassette domain-containing protein [Actinomycetota bacterium]|nr:ATP-binding cassette domain-containing protein [Actinomycetota bacterium]
MPPTGEPLHVVGLTKRFGSVTAVKDLSFEVSPGRVTGFLGPNGSGKTTTLRCLLGLVTPTSGSAHIGSAPYRALADPTRMVGAALEASGFHPARTARNHLRVIATAAGLDARRVDASLETVGLTTAAGRKVGGFSLGMRQRLALAAALLGDPGALLLDEPANGLDPEGIAWLRTFLRALAAEGRTVLVSSHVLSEVRQTVDDVVIISRGELVHAGTLADLEKTATSHTTVRSPSTEALAAALRESAPHASIDPAGEGALSVLGLSPAEVGHVAFTRGIEVHELSSSAGDLERVFLELTASGNPGGAL